MGHPILEIRPEAEFFPQEGELSHLCPSQWTNVWKEGHFLGVACEMPKKEEGSNPQAWEGPSQHTIPGPP